MSDLEKKINQLLAKHSQSQDDNAELVETLRDRQSEIEDLHRSIGTLKEGMLGSIAERHRIRHLEKERKVLKKKLEQLHKRIASIQEKITHGPKPV